MRFDFATKGSTFGKTIKDVGGFTKANRFIILSEIHSSTIPNILDMFFGLLPSTDVISPESKKTRVMVINNSEVYGSYYGLRDTRTRNVFMHYGMADTSLNNIQGDTPILFTDVDWNVLIDCPEAAMRGRQNGMVYSDLREVHVSYDDIAFNNDSLYREGCKNSKKILIPSPEFYEEKDMVVLGQHDESYIDQINENKENIYAMPEEKYIDSLYSLTLNDLIDQNTRVYKLNITVENLKTNLTDVKCASIGEDNFISELCSEIKYTLEKSGFSGAEIILDGKNGFNLRDVKTSLNLTPFEQKLNMRTVCYELSSINERLIDDLLDSSIIMTISYSNIHVKIIDKMMLIGPTSNRIDSTDTNVLELSSFLKNSSAQASFPYIA